MNSCVRKWILGERNLEQTCCSGCTHFEECMKEERKRCWAFLGHIDLDADGT